MTVAATFFVLIGVINLFEGSQGLASGIDSLVVPIGLLDLVAGGLTWTGRRNGAALGFVVAFFGILDNQVGLLFPTHLFGFPSLGSLILDSLAILLLLKAWPHLDR